VSELVIVGAGLIGCSFAAAARRAGLFSRIVAVEPDPDAATRARELGYVDEIVTAVPPEAAVLLAPPSHRIVDWLSQLGNHRGPVVDVGSVKGAVFRQLEEAGVTPPPGYVPCHPIAGGERSGPDAAVPDLFKDKLVVVTPRPDTDPDIQSRVSGWWQSLGATVEVMDGYEHDRIYASTSHLPHLLAFAYLLGVDSRHLHHSGAGFRDFSRIGASDPAMWSAVFDLNSAALLEVIGDFRNHLDQFATAIEQGDTKRLQQLIADARSLRQQLES
jgi:prephenate dehydrogenase